MAMRQRIGLLHSEGQESRWGGQEAVGAMAVGQQMGSGHASSTYTCCQGRCVGACQRLWEAMLRHRSCAGPWQPGLLQHSCRHHPYIASADRRGTHRRHARTPSQHIHGGGRAPSDVGPGRLCEHIKARRGGRGGLAAGNLAGWLVQARVRKFCGVGTVSRAVGTPVSCRSYNARRHHHPAPLTSHDLHQRRLGRQARGTGQLRGVDVVPVACVRGGRGGGGVRAVRMERRDEWDALAPNHHHHHSPPPLPGL